MDGSYHDQTEPANAADVELASPVRLTVLASGDGPLTKQYEATPDGGVKKSAGAAPMTRGSATRITLGGSVQSVLGKLQKALKKLAPAQAIMTGVPPDGRDEWEIVGDRDSQVNPGGGVVSRTAKYFKPVSGPALFALDFDIKEYPAEIRDRLEAHGGLEAVMIHDVPALAKAARLIVPSASSFIRNTTTGFCTGRSGEHWYFVLSDGQHTRRVAEIISEQLEAAGWCWGHVAKNGRVIIKTLIDKAATAPERILYEAAPELGPGLENTAEKSPHLIGDGQLIATDFVGLSDDQKATRRSSIESAKAAVSKRSSEVREAWRRDREAEMISKGVEPEKAARSVEAAAAGELQGDFEILLDDGSRVTVRDILRNPNRFDRKTCPDPVEPEYGSGRNVAVLQLGNGSPRIWSHAHGGVTYGLILDPSDFFHPIEETERWAKSPSLRIVRAPIDPGALPLREWVIYPRFPLGDVTQIVGEPGVSKSSLALLDALAVSTGREDLIAGRDEFGNPVSPERLHRAGSVVVYNAEDRLEEMERRLAAAQRHYGIGVRDMRHPVILWSGAEGEHLTVMHSLEGERGRLRPAEGARLLRQVIAEHQPALVYLDTQISLTSGGNENSNDHQNALLQELAHIAAEGRTAVAVIHHTAKATRDSHGDMGAGRGGFAAVGKVRSAVTLCNVTGDASDEKDLVIKGTGGIIRLDYAKSSYAKKPAGPILFRRHDACVGNGRGFPAGMPAAEAFDMSSRQMLEAQGDRVAVIEVLDPRPLQRAAADNDAEGRGRAAAIAQIADEVMGDLDRVELGGVWEAIGAKTREQDLTQGNARNVITGEITSALVGTGIGIQRGSASVIVKARKAGAAATAPWLLERIKEATE